MAVYENEHAEQQAIGSMLLSQSKHKILMTEDVAPVEAFTSETRRQLVQAIYEYADEVEHDDDIEISRFVRWLRDRGRLEAVGGRTHIIDCVEMTGSISLLHADEVAEMDWRKKVIRWFYRSRSKVQDEPLSDQFEATALDLLDEFQRLVKRRPGGTQTTQQLVADAVLDEDRASLPKVLTRLDSIDKQFGGFRPGELIVVGARPSVGKSTVANNIAEGAAETGSPVLICSHEMDPFDWTVNTLAAAVERRAHDDASRVPGWQIRENKLELEDRRLVQAAYEDIRDAMNRTYFMREVRTFRQLCAEARRVVPRKGIKLLVIDYLQLFRPGVKHTGEYEAVTMMSQMAKQLATELKIVVLLLSQINRNPEGISGKSHEPSLAQLRGSGAIEQDADRVLLLYRPLMTTDERTNYLKVIVAKNRNGPTGYTVQSFTGESFCVRDVPEDYWPDEWKPDA